MKVSTGARAIFATEADPASIAPGRPRLAGGCHEYAAVCISAELGPSANPRSMRETINIARLAPRTRGEHDHGPDCGQDQQRPTQGQVLVERSGEESTDAEHQEEERADHADLRRLQSELTSEGLSDDSEDCLVRVVDDVEENDEPGHRPRTLAGTEDGNC